MILKEAYRYQNFLDRLLSEAQSYMNSETFITNVKQIHHRKKANPAAEDEVIEEVAKKKLNDTYNFMPVDFTPMQIVDFAVKALEEKEKLSLAIVTAKKTTKIDIDHSIAMNKKRQEFVSSLNFMNGIKNRETKSRGTDYKFNQEENQTQS